MKVIGAGLPRTATTTLMIALEQLGFAPCYHMRDLLADLPSGLPLWEAVADGKPDWERIFGGAQSTCDWPSARYWRALIDYYPGAKVILTVRDPDAWVASMRQTVWGMFFGDSVIHYVNRARAVLDDHWRRYLALFTRMNWEPDTGVFPGDTFSDPVLAGAMRKWNDEVTRAVPAERLLVWDPREGWDPLWRFLEAKVPDQPLPWVNDTVSFREGIIGGALTSLNGWWDQRERPEGGLHGARLS